MMRNDLTFGTAALWVTGYFGVMLLYTALDVAVWRKLLPEASGWLDLICTAVCAAGFLLLLQKRYPVRWMENINISGLALALICAAGFYLVLGLLYLHMGSILCCILAHFGYNAVSYFVMLAKAKR